MPSLAWPYATPGAIRPGAAWPADPLPVSASGAVLFSLGLPFSGGGDMGFSILGMSRLATMYYLVPVTATQAGAAYNPTGDTVQFAFMPQATQVPQVSDWVAGSWDTVSSSVLYPYSAKCLIGPGGVITLGTGAYYVYLKIFDNPETPVLVAGQLEIT